MKKVNKTKAIRNFNFTQKIAPKSLNKLKGGLTTVEYLIILA